MNEQQYIAYVRENEDLLIRAIKEFHPYYKNSHKHYSVTAPGAEIACDIVRKDIQESTVKDPVEIFKEYDVLQICRIMSDVWFGMPESAAIRNHPAFNLICDLCEPPEDNE